MGWVRIRVGVRDFGRAESAAICQQKKRAAIKRDANSLSCGREERPARQIILLYEIVVPSIKENIERSQNALFREKWEVGGEGSLILCSNLGGGRVNKH